MSMFPGLDIHTAQMGIYYLKKKTKNPASDGPSDPGILYWQSLGYMTQSHSCKSTLCQNIHLHGKHIFGQSFQSLP